MAQTQVPQQLRGAGWLAGLRGCKSQIAISNWQLANRASSFKARSGQAPGNTSVVANSHC